MDNVREETERDVMDPQAVRLAVWVAAVMTTTATGLLALAAAVAGWVAFTLCAVVIVLAAALAVVMVVKPRQEAPAEQAVSGLVDADESVTLEGDAA